MVTKRLAIIVQMLIVEEACWTYTRRFLHDGLLTDGSPLARETMVRMTPLFVAEAEIHGQPPEAPYRPSCPRDAHRDQSARLTGSDATAQR